ncbi:hypothetical protein BC828DRAFT_375743 [Blastocladiella britannica]|nr:hypothetical protein BC828DRAFT_375743 [Blastocladiella britannica]
MSSLSMSSSLFPAPSLPASSAFANMSSPAIFSSLNHHMATLHPLAAILWDTQSRSESALAFAGSMVSGSDLLLRQFHGILALYSAAMRDCPPGTTTLLCAATNAPAHLRQLGVALPAEANIIDASDTSIVTELLRVALCGARQITVVSDSLGIQGAIRHLSEAGRTNVIWITSLPIPQLMAALPAVHVTPMEDLLWTGLPRSASALSLTGSTTGAAMAPQLSTTTTGGFAASMSATHLSGSMHATPSPLRYSSSTAHLSPGMDSMSMESYYAQQQQQQQYLQYQQQHYHGQSHHRKAHQYPQHQQGSSVATRSPSPPPPPPPNATPTTTTSYPASRAAAYHAGGGGAPATGPSQYPHPQAAGKWVPVNPPPDSEHIPLTNVSFGPLYHALHHPAIRDRLGPHFNLPIDLSLLGGILKQTMDPFSGLKLYLQAASECGLLRLAHLGSRCLLRVTNPAWLAAWEPYPADSVLMPGIPNPNSGGSARSGSSASLAGMSSSAAAGAGTTANGGGTAIGADRSTNGGSTAAATPRRPLTEAELQLYVPLLHAFCLARLRYPPPIRTPAVGPLLKPMFARGELAPWRKLSEYLADAERRGVVRLERLGVNGDVEVEVNLETCGAVWEDVRARYGAFREAPPPGVSPASMHDSPPTHLPTPPSTGYGGDSVGPSRPDYGVGQLQYQQQQHYDYGGAPQYACGPASHYGGAPAAPAWPYAYGGASGGAAAQQPQQRHALPPPGSGTGYSPSPSSGSTAYPGYPQHQHVQSQSPRQRAPAPAHGHAEAAAPSAPHAAAQTTATTPSTVNTTTATASLLSSEESEDDDAPLTFTARPSTSLRNHDAS